MVLSSHLQFHWASKTVSGMLCVMCVVQCPCDCTSMAIREGRTAPAQTNLYYWMDFSWNIIFQSIADILFDYQSTSSGIKNRMLLMGGVVHASVYPNAGPSKGRKGGRAAPAQTNDASLGPRSASAEDITLKMMSRCLSITSFLSQSTDGIARTRRKLCLALMFSSASLLSQSPQKVT